MKIEQIAVGAMFIARIFRGSDGLMCIITTDSHYVKGACVPLLVVSDTKQIGADKDERRYCWFMTDKGRAFAWEHCLMTVEKVTPS